MTDPQRSEPPSGRQLEIGRGNARATVVEVGGGLRTYRIGSDDVLDGYAADEMCTGARGQPLIPWPNRLRAGRYGWDGMTYTAPLNEADKGNAIHGFTRWHNWVPRETAADRVVMGLLLHPLTGYPFALDLSVEYALTDQGLVVSTTARNVGEKACPYACGAHPYLTVGDGLVDDALVHLQADTYLPTDEEQIPTGRRPVQDTDLDFRRPRPVGTTEIDYAFTDLARDDQGRAWVYLAPPGRRPLSLWVDAGYPYLELYTADTVPEVGRRRRSLGVEPMSCPPNGFATGEDVRRLEPGEQVTTRWGILPR